MTETTMTSHHDVRLANLIQAAWIMAEKMGISYLCAVALLEATS